MLSFIVILTTMCNHRKTHDSHLTSLHAIQYRAIRLITFSSCSVSTNQLLHTYNFLSASALNKYNLAIFIYRALSNNIPVSMIPQTSPVNTNNTTRFASKTNLILPIVRTNYGKQSLHFSTHFLFVIHCHLLSNY